MAHTATIATPHPASVSRSTPTDAIHPVLSRALAHLDVRLEEELVRYRRRRAFAGLRPPHTGVSFDLSMPPGMAAPPQVRPAQDVAQDRADRPIAPGTIVAPMMPPYAAPASSTNPPESSYGSVNPRSVNPRSVNPGSVNLGSVNSEPRPEDAFGLNDYLESSEELLRNLAEEEAKIQRERGFMQSLITPLGLGAMLLLLLSSSMVGYLLMNPDSLKGTLQGIRSLLTRSQPISTSQSDSPIDAATIADPSPAVLTPPSPAPIIGHPELGLHNLATIKLGPKPANYPRLTAVQGAKVATGKPSPSPAAKPGASLGGLSVVIPGAPTVKVPLQSSSPVKVNAGRSNQPIAPANPPSVVPTNQLPPSDLRWLPSGGGGGYSSGGGQSYAPPAPSYRSEPVAPARPQLAPQPAPQPLPSVVSPMPPESTAATGTDAIPPSPSPTGGKYSVVAPYTGDRALDTVQGVQPDAALTNDGREIQAGQFDSAEAAEAQAEKLREQGVEAEVKPN